MFPLLSALDKLWNKQSSFRWFKLLWGSSDVTAIYSFISDNLTHMTLTSTGHVVWCDAVASRLLSQWRLGLYESSAAIGRNADLLERLWILQWRHYERDSVSNHQRLDCLFNLLFRRRSKKTPKLHVTGLYEGIHWWPVDSAHKGPVTRKTVPFDDVIMKA